MSDRFKIPPTCVRCSTPVLRARDRSFHGGRAVHVRCTDRSSMEDAYEDERRSLAEMAAGKPVRARGEAIYDRERAP